MIGSNIFITTRLTVGSKSSILIRSLKTRVALDGGVFGAESCLKTQLDQINRIN